MLKQLRRRHHRRRPRPEPEVPFLSERAMTQGLAFVEAVRGRWVALADAGAVGGGWLLDRDVHSDGRDAASAAPPHHRGGEVGTALAGASEPMTGPVERLGNGAMIVQLEAPDTGYGIARGDGVVVGIRRNLAQACEFAAGLSAMWVEAQPEPTLSWSHRAQGRVRELGPGGSRARDREQG
jgi:hypothetical protein